MNINFNPKGKAFEIRITTTLQGYLNEFMVFKNKQTFSLGIWVPLTGREQFRKDPFDLKTYSHTLNNNHYHNTKRERERERERFEACKGFSSFFQLKIKMILSDHLMGLITRYLNFNNIHQYS
jgi:hypothetical protein